MIKASLKNHGSAFFVLLVFFLFCFHISVAEDEKPDVFIDFDGDGFDDNIDDSDGDGILDTADPDFEPEPDNIQGGLINFSAGIDASGLKVDLTTNSDKFGKRKFCARSLEQNRCGFDCDSDFGAGAGIGIGASSGGGGCAGGVCR